MNGKIGMRAFSVLLALLLVSVMMVPVVAMDAKTPDIEKLDIVDTETLQKRSPSFISELRSKGCSEEEIAEAIRSLPQVSYLDGWTEADDKRVSPLLQQARDEVNYSMHGEIDPLTEDSVSAVKMCSSGIWLFDTVFQGVNGWVHPGPMECSSDGTRRQFLTTHLGKKIGTTDNWIEIGIETFCDDPNPARYHVFTYDNNDVVQQMRVHANLTNGDRDYNFEIYVSDVQYPEGYPYMILWEGQVVRVGHVPFAEGDLNEVHEYVRNDPGSFSDVSTSYVWDSYVYYDGYGVWWNEQLDAQLAHPTYLNADTQEGVYGDFYRPWWSNAYRIDTWIA